MNVSLLAVPCSRKLLVKNLSSDDILIGYIIQQKDIGIHNKIQWNFHFTLIFVAGMRLPIIVT